MIEKLIVVAGHSVYTGKDFNDVYDDKNWFLFPFQKGEPKLYIQHIETGCKIASEDENSLLIFTGGQTRKEAGFRSEANGYFEVANALGLITEKIKDRVILDEFSRDSFENLLFPICRFREYLGYYPSRIDFITFGFKKSRFYEHCKAIRFPISNVKFIAPNNPEDLSLAMKNEMKVIELIKSDPYQTNGELLEKRNSRNPWKRENGYRLSAPELKDLLEYDGKEYFKGKLPWD